ncbi:MAG: 16S rRNA (cytosine(1402)-N(4))-methyltransferase RsmH [Planctomycetes bacterium]|nr:16S rRNA (cytosine(1402)-N(4))-methyltransferase RsmH [Planctomycetota bacterium]
MSDTPRGDRPPVSSVHQPVLVREVLDVLAPRPGQTVVDGTVGGGGHARKILERIGPSGLLVGLDRDPAMLARAAARLQAYENCRLVQSSYARLPQVLQDLGLEPADAVLLDLGLSSDQLAEPERGFGFDSTSPLDLRFDPTEGQPAWQLLAEADADELVRIFTEYGEERFAEHIARRIVERRSGRPVHSGRGLVEAVAEAIPRRAKREARRNQAARVFQALRIAVNDELRQLERALANGLPESVAPGGRLAVISFHSLEDRLVKNAFRGDDRWHILTPKPLTPRPNEVRANPRSRTAKLRAATRT